ncbi:MAG: hypothetical protein ABFC84_05765 [Veillonellales bacterium]
MQGGKKEYISVWGDTVDFKELLIGMFAGAMIGYASFAGGIWFLRQFFSSLPKGLFMGYALLFGIAGCLIAGGVAAKAFKAKRIFLEDSSCVDLRTTLEDLNLDLSREAEYLKYVPADVQEEMKELQLYQLFSKESDNNPASNFPRK